MARLARVKRLGLKVAHLAPEVARRPRLLPLMLGGVHPEHYLRLDANWVRDAGIKTVLDIGANTGQFTGAVRAVLPEATIYAFEPLPECCRELKSRFADAPTVCVFGVALGEEDGEVTFHRNVYSQSSSVLELADLHRQMSPWASKTEPVPVPMRRLDSLLPDLDLIPPVIIKIDVQGYEDRVLRGGAQVIREARYVLVETAFEPLYEAQATFAAVYDMMIGYGFRFAGNLNQIENPADGRPLFADALFVCESR
jgi:FkbM family methyltransferase